jgi:hypothetical protein
VPRLSQARMDLASRQRMSWLLQDPKGAAWLK